MLKVAMITRNTLYTVRGGDTVQVVQTARHLAALGVQADILLTSDEICYHRYDLLHFFNITRPADILCHIARAAQPFVVSTIHIDYSEYDRHHRKGLTGLLLRLFSADRNEYIKTIGRCLAKKDQLRSPSFVWKGQKRSVDQVLRKAAMLLPNSEHEYQRLRKRYRCPAAYKVVCNGIDHTLFRHDRGEHKEDTLVLCVARIEGIKNQLNLIRALNGTRYRLLLIGAPAPNQPAYYRACRLAAAANIVFVEQVSQPDLVDYYRRAKVHVLPSWFETTGLSSLEAAAMGCNVVITDRGDTQEYFGAAGFYCEPASPGSILHAVDRAARAPVDPALAGRIREQYNWRRASQQTLEAYQKIIAS